MFPIRPILAAGFDSEASISARLARFAGALFDARFDSADCVFWSAVMLGVTCGLLGCFIVLRRQSLLGDAVGHAVLPGVCLGFLVAGAGAKSTPALLAGATAAGLLAAGLIGLLQRTTNLKPGECIGVVFTGFYGLGIVLLKNIQNQGLPGQSGLDKFLFGQIAAVSTTDTIYIAVIAAMAVASIVVFWRKLAVSSFDESFAQSVGLPVHLIHYLLTGLLTVAIVISIQAVGVVLVAAMLVTPAATAYLLTDRLHRMAILSSLLGATAGVLGAVLSLLGNRLPTGAFMVLSASGLFALAFLLSPRHGLLPRLMRLWERRRRTQAENLLRTLFIMLERRLPAGREREADALRRADRRFGVDDVAALRHESPGHVRRLWELAADRGWVRRDSRDPILLTDEGLDEARRIVRNHRLWELFLTTQAHLQADHVHADAEYIEHVLPRDVLARLERMLDNPAADPHGRAIP